MRRRTGSPPPLLAGIYAALTSTTDLRCPAGKRISHGRTASELQSFSPYVRAGNSNTAKGGSVSASAQPDIAEDSKRSRADRARLRLVLPIGVIVAVAIVCVIVAVLTSARRADEVSLNREQELIQQAIADRGARVLREVESVAATERAAETIRRNYDPQWVERRVGNWLETISITISSPSSTLPTRSNTPVRDPRRRRRDRVGRWSLRPCSICCAGGLAQR